MKGKRATHLQGLLWLFLVWLPSRLPAQGLDINGMRRALAFAEAMRPAGLAAIPVRSAVTVDRLKRVPQLQRAVAQAALDNDGTLPFHLRGTFTLTGDLVAARAGTLEADRYNDRWSRLTVTLGDAHATLWVIDGRRVVDDGIIALPFHLQRLLRAVFAPLATVVATKVAITADTALLQGQQLPCTVFAAQPAPDGGIVTGIRVACVDPTTGDLRLDIGDYGFQARHGDFQTLGGRRVAGLVQILQGNTTVAELHQTLSVAADLTPQTILSSVPSAILNRREELRFCWMAWPGEVRNDLQTLDVRMIPLGEIALRQHAAMVVARVLVGTDGTLADLELLHAATPALRERARQFLRTARFRRREWQGHPVLTEGLLLLGPP